MDEKQRASVGFGKLLAAMNTLGFSADEQKAIWHVLAGIYHLGVAGTCKGKSGLDLQLYFVKRKVLGETLLSVFPFLRGFSGP